MLVLPFLACAAPPDLNYDFAADVVGRAGLQSTLCDYLAVSEPAIACGHKPDFKTNASERVISCSDGLNTMYIDSFFDEHVCYNLTLQERRPITNRELCLANNLKDIMPLTGAVLAACNSSGVRDWCMAAGSLNTPAWSTLYSQSTRVGSAKYANRTVQKWESNSQLGTYTFLVDPQTKVLYKISKQKFVYLELHNLVTPAPPTAIMPPIDGKCVNMSAVDPFFEHVALSSVLRRGAQQPEWGMLVDDPDFIEEINSEPGLPWRAGRSWFGNFTIGALASQLLGLQPRLLGALTPSPHKIALSAGAPPPSSFDAREHWKSCPSIGTIRNQGTCGSCWAFSAAETFSDRWCIATNAAEQPEFAPESLIDCDATDNGCGGGYQDNVWRFLRDVGAREEACMPYAHCDNEQWRNCSRPHDARLADGPLDESCPTACANGSTPRQWRSKNAYAVAAPGDVDAIKRELLAHGPVQVGMFVFNDFMQYAGGVYKRSTAVDEFHPVGRHAVKLIGWGEEHGLEYWTVANSWSHEWGENGFFRIVQGTNECGIESTPAAGLPAI